MENLTDVVAENLISKISSLTTFIQAIGGLIFLYLIFNIITLIINKGKKNELKKIRKNLEEIKKFLRKRRSNK